MKNYSFFKRTSFFAVLILLFVLSLIPPVTHAQTQKEEWTRALSLFNDGHNRLNHSDFRGAIRQWEEALAIFKKLGQKQAIGTTIGNLGLAYSYLGDYRRAISYYEQALAIAKEMGNRKNEGIWVGNLGLAYGYLGDYRKAVSYYERALAIAVEIGDIKNKAAWLGSLGSVYVQQGDYRKAIAHYEQALPLTEDVGDKNNKGAVIGNLGHAYLQLGDYRRAIAHYEQALAIAEEIGAKKNKGFWLGSLGNAYRQLGDYRKSISYYEQALTILEEIGDKQGKGMSLGHLGLIYSYLGDYRKAVSYYEQAMAIAEEIGDKISKGASLNNLGIVSSDLGNYQKAISYYEQPLAIAEEIGDKNSKGISLSNLGNAYSFLGDYRKAIPYYEQAIAIYKQIGVPYSVPENNMADAYLALNRDEEAFAIYAKNDTPIRLGRFYLKKKDFRKAIAQFDRDREADEQQKAASFIISRWIGLGLSHEGQKEYGKAYGWYTKAIDFMEEQRAALTPSEREHYFEGNEFRIPRIEAYEGAVRCAFMLGKLDDAFFWSENTRGRILSELLSRRHSGEIYKIPAQLAQEEADLTTQIMINKKQQQTAFQKNNSEILKQVEDEYPALRRKMDSLIDRLRKEYPQYAAIKYPQPIKLSQLALRKGETIIEYEVTGPYTIGLVIRDGKVIKGFKVEKTRAEIENLVRRFRSPFQSGQDANEFSLNLAKELTDTLLKPAVSDLNKNEHLIIVPDEALSILPFEALLLDAPAKVLKEEAIMLAQTRKQGEREAIDRREIIRGLSKTSDNRGVAIAPRVSMHILFDTGSAQIGKSSRKQMTEILAALKSKELNSAQIRIEGHTDSIGDPGYNLKLSRSRAEAVYQYLKSGGIKENLLDFTGKGDTEPVADNATEKGRKQNRRVDLVRLLERSEAKSSSAASQGLVYAMDEYPISYYQSASVLSLQRGLNTSRVKNRAFFGLGDPVFDTQDERSTGMRSITIAAKKDTASPDITGSEGTKEAGYRFSRLENTAKEVKEVSSLFPDSRILIGPDASKDNLKREDLTSRRYVLFSTHGILGNELPYIKQPALVMNLVGNKKEEDGFLTATEIFNMNMNADLVGLSACQTGLGIQSAGEGVVGLSRAFMYAGTDSVLVSLWSVSDESTYRLMVRFFEELNKGKDKLTALKEAKNYLRTSGYDNPFYWAPFILVGEAN